MCSKEDLINDDWSIPIVFVWSSRRDDCNIHLIITHCCSNVLIDRMDSMTFVNTIDLTHWATWGYLLSTWKQKYSLSSGGKCVVFGTSIGKIGKVVINGVKQGGVDVAWTLIFYFRGVTHEWISSVFKIYDVFWIAILSEILNTYYTHSCVTPQKQNISVQATSTPPCFTPLTNTIPLATIELTETTQLSPVGK